MAGSEQVDALIATLQKLREPKLKVAERTDLISKAHELLSADQLQIALDYSSSEASGAEHGRKLGWCKIVKYIAELVDTERSDNETKREKRKAVTPSYKRDFFDLWRTTIQQAFARRSTNRTTSVNLAAVEKTVANLFSVDQDSAFGYTGDALDVLVLVMKNDGAGLHSITADDWHALFDVCCSLVKTAVNRSASKINLSVAAEAVGLLVAALPNSARALVAKNVHICCNSLLTLFELLLPTGQRERSVTYLMRALNVLLSKLCVKYRKRLAKLALGIAPHLVNEISLSPDDGSNADYQKLLTTFFTFLFVLEQPDCVSVPNVAVLLRLDSECWMKWKEVVKGLYIQFIAIELPRVLNRSESNQKGRRDTSLTEEQTELIARTIVVCHDLGDEISLALPAASALMSTTLNNQTRALDSTATGAASSKRRQIQVGYAFLFDSITEMATKRRYPKPCYQILSKLLTRWHHRLSTEEYDFLISGLVNSLTQLKRQEAIKWTMLTISSTLRRAALESRLAHLWATLLDHCLVALHNRTLQSSAATVLVEMLRYAVLSNTRNLNLARLLSEVYSMDSPSAHAVESLTAIVGLVDFDEKVAWRSLSNAVHRPTAHAFRFGVVDWLFQTVDEDDLNAETEWVGIGALSSIPAQQLADLAAMLCVQYPQYCSSPKTESHCSAAANPWSKIEQILVDAFALSSSPLDPVSPSVPFSESSALRDVVAAVIELFVNGSSIVRSACTRASDSTSWKGALVRHLNLGMALSGQFDIIGCKDHEDMPVLDLEIELLAKLVLNKTLTNASNKALCETLSALGEDCVNAPLLEESLLLRLGSLAAGEVHACVNGESPNENRFVHSTNRKRSAPLERSVERQRPDRSDCSIEMVQQAAWECMLRFHESENNSIRMERMLKEQASSHVQSWMLESVLSFATRTLDGVAELLLCENVCHSLRERIDSLIRARNCCSQKQLFAIWSRLWSEVEDAAESANKQCLLNCVLDVFDANTIASSEIDGSRLTTVLLETENCGEAQLLKLAQLAKSSLFTVDQLHALLQRQSLGEQNLDDPMDECVPWLNTLTFVRLVANIVSDPSAADLHSIALFHLLHTAISLSDVWRLFVEQMIPNLKERLCWHFSLIARWWITHELSWDKIPLAMVGCASEDDFFKRFSNELMGSMAAASGSDINVKSAHTRSALSATNDGTVSGVRQATALLCAGDDDDKLCNFVDSAKSAGALEEIWPLVVVDLLKWQYRSTTPIQVPHMPVRRVKRAIERLMLKMQKASLTTALNEGLGKRQKTRSGRAESMGSDSLLAMCTQLRTMVLDSCGQYAHALHAFHTLLFEVDLGLLDQRYLPFLIRETWWTCTVCIRQSVREKRRQDYVALLVRDWAEMSERLLDSVPSAIGRIEFAVSAVMDLFERQTDYPEASAEAASKLLQWLTKLDVRLTWKLIPLPPVGLYTDSLRRLIIKRRQLSVQQELAWFATAELHLLTVGFWQHFRQLLESAAIDNLQMTANEHVTGKLLALWRRRGKWRSLIAPILALLSSDHWSLNTSYPSQFNSLGAFVLHWASCLLFDTSNRSHRQIFDALRQWLSTDLIGTEFDVSVKKWDSFRCQELLPFRNDKCRNPVQPMPIGSDKLCFFAHEWPQPISFDFWLRKIVAGVVAETFSVNQQSVELRTVLRSFEAFISRSADFAQALVPFVCEILIQSSNNHRAHLAIEFNNILSALKTPKVEDKAKLSIALVLLEILRHLSSIACRLKSNDNPVNAAVIPLDFALLAEVLVSVNLPHSALFYAEIACDEKCEPFRATQLFDDSGRTLLDMVDPRDELRRTMMNAVMQVGDVDSLKGLGQLAFVDPDARRFLAEKNHCWERMASLYSRADSPVKFAKALQMLGIDDVEAPLDVQYENLWKLGRWQQLSAPKQDGSLNGRMFGVLTAIKDGNDNLANRLASDLMQHNMEQMCERNVPDMFNLRWHRSIGGLQRLALTAYKDGLPEMCRAIDGSLQLIGTDRLSVSDSIGDELAMETSLLLAKLAAAPDALSRELTFQSLSNLVTARAKALNKSQDYQQSLRLVNEWDKLVIVHSDIHLLPAYRLQPTLEAASALWKRDDLALSKNQVESVIDKLKPLLSKRSSADPLANEKLLQVVSKSYALLAKLQSFNGGDQDTALQEACAVLERAKVTNSNLGALLSKMNWRLGRYTEAKYRTLRAYRESSEFKTKEMAVAHWDKQINALTATDRLLLHRLRSESRLEKMDIASSDNVLRSLLATTVQRYVLAVQYGDAHDLCMYLLIDLWMDNRDDEQLCTLIHEQVSLVASHKWLLVWNQLSSRVAPLENDCAQLHSVTEALLTRVARDHPYHTINSLFYIGEIETADMKTMPQDDKSRMDRIRMARNILKDLKKKGDMGRVVDDMHDAHKAFLQIINTPIAQFTLSKDLKFKGLYEIPKSMSLLRLDALKNLPIPTLTIPVDKSLKYSDLVRFSDVRSHCSKAEGKSVPKVLRVVDSGGIEHRIIFKTGDDLHQDVLVEQVFEVANLLLASSKRPACMRTYNVVPLNRNGGLIEWCENTTSLCNYLVGQDKSSGAHAKYHPSDLTGKDCITKMKEAADKEKKALAEKSDKRSSNRHALHEPTELPHVFRSICERFHPVFRHFFYERFADPADWCRRRSDYTVSVATWSMVCHLVGLGDRHLNNILIDECTAEIVHIDLGMAFEYSRRALQVPEQVPFRLTRDMLDPMGAWGIDGLFTATCMRTMAVMRAHKSVLLAVVSILMHDPVASFQERPIKLDEKPSGGRKVQPPPANRNGLAETAIARMAEKLSGRETIDKVEMTIDRQVAYLIDEARNPDNLCKMFFGWMAFA